MYQLISCTSKKHKLSYHFAHVSLENFEEEAVNVVLVCDAHFSTHRGPPTKEHSHMEAEKLNPLRVLLKIKERILQEERVWSPDRHKRRLSAHGLGVERSSQCHDKVDPLSWKDTWKCVLQKNLNDLPPVPWWKWPNLWHFWPPWRRINVHVNCKW